MKTLLFVLFLALIALRAFSIVTWSWWLVLLPVWIYLGGIVIGSIYYDYNSKRKDT